MAPAEEAAEEKEKREEEMVRTAEVDSKSTTPASLPQKHEINEEFSIVVGYNFIMGEMEREEKRLVRLGMIYKYMGGNGSVKY
jgi:hypothetical protein